VEGIRQNQRLIRADFEVALELATQLDFLYENGDFDQKRLLCETVLKRIYVEHGKITRAEYNPPFAIIARSSDSGSVTSGGAYEIRTRDFPDTIGMLFQKIGRASLLLASKLG